jgi:hypothetical protein
LKHKGKTISELARHLKSDQSAVKEQLDSFNTFSYADLINICAFFNELPSDFFFEVLPIPSSEIYKDVRDTRKALDERMERTHSQLVNSFRKNISFN